MFVCFFLFGDIFQYTVKNDVILAKIYQMKMVHFKRAFAYFCEGAKHCCNILHCPTAFYHIILTLFLIVPSECLTKLQRGHDPKSIAFSIIYAELLMSVVYETG